MTGSAEELIARLRANPEDPAAFAELRALLAAREKLYARADHTIETSGRRVAGVVSDVAALVD